VSGAFGSEEHNDHDVASGLIEEDLDGAERPVGEAADGTPPEADEIEEIEVERSPLDQARLERDEYLDALRRLQAEFDNYRKRMARQQGELVDRATESLLERLLPLLDALDLAIAHAAPGEAADPDGQTAVLVQIGAMLRDLLQKEGLERIDEADVEFDPTVHDAVAHVPSEDPESTEHLIDDVLRPGYRLKGRVLRPAMVRVRG